MALYTCSKCGKKVPEQYEICPFCHTPRPKSVEQEELPTDFKKLKQCKTCGAVIAKSAKVCPKCGEKQKKKHPILGAVLTIFGILIFISAIGSALNGSNQPQKVGDMSGDKSQTVSQSTNGSKSEDRTTFSVGEKVSLNDIVVTLVDVKESSGANYMTPDDGNVFIICEFEIENNSNKDITVSSIMSFDAYVDDYSTNISMSAELSSDKNQLDGSVAIGKKMNGVIGYEASKDWKSIEIRFTPDFWTGKEIIFTADK